MYRSCNALAARLVFAFAMLCAVAVFSAARAEGTFISAKNRVDIAYDDARGLLYISSGDSVLRYQLSTATFLTPVTLGGNLMGMDISPDGKTLAVADDTIDKTEKKDWVHLVDLDTLVDNKVTFDVSYLEGGTFSVAYDSDGKLLISERFKGSSQVKLRLYDPASGTATVIATVEQDTMLTANANRKIIALEQSNNSSGPFGRYKVKDGSIAENIANWYLYEIGVSPNGKIYAVPTQGGTLIADKGLNLTGTIIGQNAGPQPIGVAFDPKKRLVYFPWAGTTMVKVYDTKTWKEVDEFDFADTFYAPSNHAFVQGRAKTSRDGSLLFVTVTKGVRYVSTRNHHHE